MKRKEKKPAPPAPEQITRAIARRVRQHVIGKPQTFFAVVQPGFEEVARDELSELGIENFGEPVEGGVEFTSKLEGCYRVNVAARTVTRVVMRLFDIRLTNLGDLSKKITALPWELYLPDGAAVAFKVSSERSPLYHEGLVEIEMHHAIAARLQRYEFNMSAADAEDGPDVQEIVVRLRGDRCQFSIDTSGGLLYKRGRKPFVTEASLRETLAAGILRAAGWKDANTLIDPMCGSGTFTLEALEMASGRLANAERVFPFKFWPAFRPAAFAHLLTKLTEAARAAKRPVRIIAFDNDAEAVAAARGNLARSGLDTENVEIRKSDFFDPESATIPPDSRPLLVLNPPYGKRLRKKDTGSLFRRIGETVRHHYRGGHAVIVPGLELEKALSLTYDRKILFRNGGLPVAVICKLP
jgi:putative N6-adenine-specific DNA methylase